MAKTSEKMLIKYLDAKFDDNAKEHAAILVQTTKTNGSVADLQKRVSAIEGKEKFGEGVKQGIKISWGLILQIATIIAMVVGGIKFVITK